MTSKSPRRTKSNTIQLPWTTNLYQTPILNRYVGYPLFTGPRSSSTASSEKEATAPGLSVVSKHFLRISMTTCHISSIISPETISHNSDSRAHNPTKPPSWPSANHPTSAPSFQKQCAAISPQERRLRWARCSSSGCVRLLTIGSRPLGSIGFDVRIRWRRGGPGFRELASFIGWYMYETGRGLLIAT